MGALDLFKTREKNDREQKAVAEYQKAIDEILSREEDIIKTVDEKKNLGFAATETEFLLSDVNKLLKKMYNDNIESAGVRMQIASLEQTKERLLSMKSDLSSGERSLEIAKSLGDMAEETERKNRFIQNLNRQKDSEES